MQLKTRTPRDFINALLSKKAIHPAPFGAFKQALADLVQTTKAQHATGQTEPNMVTNALKPFIDSLGYTSSAYSQKGQIGIDLVIQKDGKPAVIIEAKRPSSREMMTEQDINKKAFHEAIYYFMRERDAGNNGLTSVVVTDFYNWFVFDAKDFERLFWDNAVIQKIYQTHKNPHLLSNTTADFYQTLKAALHLVNPEVIECAHFNLLLTYSDKELAAIYKLLSADCLLKVFNPNDANSLNREFYNELLYILGLEEVKQGGKKIIGRALTPQAGSLYENASEKLAHYYKDNDFEAVIKLLIIWINRILFLKLLESQIVTWTDKTDHKFLLPSKISDYVSLENLFFNILAKKIQDRGSNHFDYIPYLNSSLFEVHPDEINGITIATLAGDAQIDYYNKTVVKDALSHRKTGKVNTLAYLFEFLDAYDFANDSKDEITTDNKSLISASVLGLIFEKINGYKDGSFYTPSFVTMYMARETIEKTVLQKFNLAKNWKCKTLVELDNKLNVADIVESNSIINDIKICDPAVGSGHFLVSALNEILRIKSLLGILMDESGKRIKDYAVTIENDELILKNFEDGTFFEYKKEHLEKTRIQKTLFKEKQKIIENCLFGVDINPNSVNICRLRLWVELLKNAYYKPDATLDALPNIDINIKCGNSLISRFGIKDNLKSRSIQAEVKDYKNKVIQYKQNIGSKRDVAQAIEALKTKFSKTLKAGHGSSRGLQDVLGKYVTTYGFDDLSKDLIAKAVEWNFFGKQVTLIKGTVNAKNKVTLVKQILALQEQVQEIESGAIYKNAFEWRFEFPEVLNDKGEFIGFDLVIANPPYIDSETMVSHGGIKDRNYIVENYQLAKGNWDIYIPFFERSISILGTIGIVSFITPDKWLTKPFGIELRTTYANNFTKIVKAGRDIFDSANIDSLITIIDKNHAGSIQSYIVNSNQFILKQELKISDPKSFSFDILFSDYSSLISKIERAKMKISNLALCENACATSDAYKLKDFLIDNKKKYDITKHLKIINTGTIGKYNSRYGAKPMTYLKDKYLLPIVQRTPFLKNFTNSYGMKSIKPKLIGKSLTLLDWCLDEFGEFIPGKSTLVFTSDDIDLLKLISAILNSKIIFFYISNKYSSASYNGGINFTKDMMNNIPVNSISNPFKKIIITKVNSIIAAKNKGADTASLEQELDNLIYKLYDLTLAEIKTIDPEFTLTAAQYEALG